MSILPKESKKYSVSAKTDEPYAKEVCKVLIAKPCSIGQIAKDNAGLNELYAQALQPFDKYQSFFTNKFSRNGTERYFTVDDLDFSPLGLCKKIFASMYSRLNKVDSYTNIELVDEKSKNEQKRYIIELETLLELQGPINEALGADIIGQKLKSKSKLKDYTPKTIEELQFYQTIGYKNSIEVLLEKHIDIINNGNNFKFEINPLINKSLITAGVCCTHVYFGQDNKICEEPISIRDLKVIGGTKRNYSDANAFIIDQKFNVDSFYEMIKNELHTSTVAEGGDITYHPNILDDTYTMLTNAADKTGVLNVKLCYWSTVDEHSMKVMFQDNKVILRNHNGSSHVKNKIQKWYRAYYIPSIDQVYKYGPIENMSRKKENGKIGNAYSPVILIRGINKDLTSASPIYNIKKFEDIATILWVKYQNEIARMKPTRTDIDIKSLAETAELLKVVMPDIQVTDLMNALNIGTGFVGTQTLDGKQSNPNTYRTVTYPVQMLNMYLQVINQMVDICFQFAGTPKVDIGIEQDERKSNYSTKAELFGADKAIMELFEQKDELIRASAETKANMVVRLYQSKDKIPNPYANMFDDYEADMLSDIDFAINREFTVQVEKGFTEEDIYEIKQNLAQQNQRFVQTGGKDGLDFSDNLIIQEILKDNPKIARYKIQVLVERRKKEAKEYALEQMKLNNQAQQVSNQQAQQGQAQLLAMEAQMKKMQQEFEMALEAMKIDKKQQAEAKNIILEHQLNMQNEQDGD
jgi:hypothetical protein